jgi:hypothetical protein
LKPVAEAHQVIDTGRRQRRSLLVDNISDCE